MKILNKNFFFDLPEKKKILVIGDRIDYAKREDSFFKGILIDYNVYDTNFVYLNFWVLILTITKLNFNKRSYLKELINLTSPKIIITAHDNDWEFYKLKNQYSHIKFISIQNGWRGKKMDMFDDILLSKYSNQDLKCDYLLTFNNAFAELYKKYIKTKTLSTGSVLANSYVVKKKIENKISFLLQFRSKKRYPVYTKTFKGENIYWDDLFLPTGKILEYLDEYCSKKNIDLNIIGRTRYEDEHDEEKKFIEKHVKGKFNYNRKKKKFSSYDSAINSKVIVSISSTLSYEMIGLGNRVVNINTRKSVYPDIEDTFLWPLFKEREGVFWTENLNKDYIFEMLNFAYFSSDKDWNDKTQCYTKDLIVLDQGNTLLNNLMKNLYEK